MRNLFLIGVCVAGVLATIACAEETQCEDVLCGQGGPSGTSTQTGSDATTSTGGDDSASDDDSGTTSSDDSSTAIVDSSSPVDTGVAPADAGPSMSFFVTAVGSGNKGGNLGGLTGADAICQAAATAVGAGSKTWKAYLSTNTNNGGTLVHAKDRIGNGPWYNVKGEMIAQNVADLHGDNVRDRNQINKQFALNEKGEVINGRGDMPNRHDILTGSQSDGRAYPAGEDRTCRNWTSSTDGSAMLGHHDRSGGGNTSWNQAHPSRGCSQENLISTGGDGLLYCFAIN